MAQLDRKNMKEQKMTPGVQKTELEEVGSTNVSLRYAFSKVAVSAHGAKPENLMWEG